MDETAQAAMPDRTGRNAVLSCIGVRKAWRKDSGLAVPALDGVDLEIAEGEAVAVVGPSGCGKTTLLRLLAGLDMPDTGRVTTRGTQVTGPSPDRPLVFQHPTLFPWLTVWENIGFGLAMRGVPRARQRATALTLLAATGMPDIADRHPDALSLGMRQRVAVVRAIAIGPSLLLLDEPFAALDVQTRRRMQGFLEAVLTTSRAAVVLVTHDLDEAMALCDRVVLLSAQPARVLLQAPGERSGPKRGAGRARPVRGEIEELLRVEADRAYSRAG